MNCWNQDEMMRPVFLMILCTLWFTVINFETENFIFNPLSQLLQFIPKNIVLQMLFFHFHIYVVLFLSLAFVLFLANFMFHFFKSFSFFSEWTNFTFLLVTLTKYYHWILNNLILWRVYSFCNHFFYFKLKGVSFIHVTTVRSQ